MGMRQHGWQVSTPTLLLLHRSLSALWGYWFCSLLNETLLPLFNIFSAAKRVHSLLHIIMLLWLLQPVLHFHCCCFINYLKPAVLQNLLRSVWIWEKQVIDETEIVLQNVICSVFNELSVYKWSSSNIALYPRISMCATHGEFCTGMCNVKYSV